MNYLQEYSSFLKLLADESSKIIRQYFRTKINFEQKSDASPVTIADKKAEEKLRELISKNFPHHGIIGEEFGNENSDAEFVWVLDPIDGTKSFICGALSFGTLIALLHNGRPVLGVINHPILDEFLIGDNSITLLNEVPVNVSNQSELYKSVLLTTDHLNAEKYLNKEKFNQLINSVNIYRNWGDCYGYYLLATGYADIMIDPIMSVWDKMALIPIVRGAGGIITDCEGNSPEKGTNILAANSFLHQQVVKFLT